MQILICNETGQILRRQQKWMLCPTQRNSYPRMHGGRPSYFTPAILLKALLVIQKAYSLKLREDLKKIDNAEFTTFSEEITRPSHLAEGLLIVFMEEIHYNQSPDAQNYSVCSIPTIM